MTWKEFVIWMALMFVGIPIIIMALMPSYHSDPEHQYQVGERMWYGKGITKLRLYEVTGATYDIPLVPPPRCDYEVVDYYLLKDIGDGTVRNIAVARKGK